MTPQRRRPQARLAGKILGCCLTGLATLPIALAALSAQEPWTIPLDERVTLEIGEATGTPRVQNMLTVEGTSVPPSLEATYVFLPGRISIVGDVSVFVRGDSDGDDRIDLSDAVTTLGYLFLGGPSPHCYDAADANDDGIMNLTDSIHLLGFLFLGAVDRLPAPYPQAGTDPTDDVLGCRVGW